METFKYFAYGSNMLRERILINNPSAKVYGVGKLNGFRFSFDTPKGVDTNWLGPGATIIPVGCSSSVYGIIWDVEVKDLESLNRQEWCYKALQVDVEVVSETQSNFSAQSSPEVLQCRTYRITTGDGNTLPSPHYKEVILMGAKQNGLPEDYISFLKELPDNQITEVPPAYTKLMAMLKNLGET